MSTRINPWEWDEPFLLNLIDQQIDENRELEYKGPKALGRSVPKKNEIGKDVSAFANSAGGTIVYGISESSGNPPTVTRWKKRFNLVFKPGSQRLEINSSSASSSSIE